MAVGVALAAALSALPAVLIATSPASAAPRFAATTSPGTSTTTATTTTTTTTTASLPSVGISGKTSQRRRISFRLTFAAVENLRYRIVDRCPHRRHLLVHSWGFPPLVIMNSHFGGKFAAKPPAAATTTIAGKIAGVRVTGSLSDRTRRAKTRGFCFGKATFSLAMRPAGHKPTGRTLVRFAPRPRQ
jgi:hypothetical protein